MEQTLFDYQSFAKKMQIPASVICDFEKDVQQEFPNDVMLGELHILRAINAYARKNLHS